MSDTIGNAPFFRIEDATKRYGGIQALRGANLTITRSGIVHGLIGENGSGKSTTLGIMSGQTRPDSGTMRLNGEEIRLHNPLEAISHGVVMVSQETALVPDLSVAENILLGHRTVKSRFGIDWPATYEKAARILARLDLDIDPKRIVRTIPPDMQQMIEIARALSMDAKILILDEPTSSLTDDQVEVLFTVIQSLKEQGVATVFVSHRLAEMMAIADELTVLRDGETVAFGPMGEFDVHRIVDEMVGRKDAWKDLGKSARRESSFDGASKLLEVENLSVGNVIRNAYFHVAAGEIVGIAGLEGSGRHELLETLFGAREVSGGSIRVRGKPYVPTTARNAIAAGLGYLPPDRKLRGLVLGQSVSGNLIMTATAFKNRLLPCSRKTTEDAVAKTIDSMQIRAATPEVAVSTLSGGNQQKVALGKWLLAESKILLLDEPTRGVDVAAKDEIHKLLVNSASEDTACLVSSSENEELLQLCDRILVMFRGEIVASISADDADEALLSQYTGGHVPE